MNNVKWMSTLVKLKKIMNKDKVSIIMPLYNAEKYVEQAIVSVISQTYETWELIVVDDCSNDSSFSIVESIMNNDDSAVKALREEVNELKGMKCFKEIKNSM